MLIDGRGLPIVWPNVAWSYSALDLFEKCGLHYRQEKVRRAYAFVESEQMKAGKVTHKQLEDFVMAAKPLPLGLKSMGDRIMRMADGALEVYPERSINLTYELDACGTFDPNVSYRGVIDLTIVRKDAIIITDYKTSKEPREPFDQLEMNALAVMCEQDVDKRKPIHAMFGYTKHPWRRMDRFTATDAAVFAHSMIPRLERLKEARDKDLFTASPGFWCKWCPVDTCSFNPKFKVH